MIDKLLDGPHFFGQLRLVTLHKASTIYAVEEANPIRTERQTPTEAIIQAPSKQTPVQTPAQYDIHEGHLNILSDDLVQPHDQFIIIDSMAIVQCMNKSSGLKKIVNFKDAFVKRITKVVKLYDEEHIIFDCYDTAQSLKQKTQGKEMEFAIHDEMDLAKIILKELLSTSKTKALLSNIPGNDVLEEYKGSKNDWTTWCIHQAQFPHSKRRQVSTDHHSCACECHWPREVSRSDWFSYLHKCRLRRELFWHLKEKLDHLVPILAQ